MTTTLTLVDTTEEFWELVRANYGTETVNRAKENTHD